MEEKPIKYQLTENLGPKILIGWYIVFFFFGLVFFEFPEGLRFPIIGALGSFFSIFLVRKVLQFQKTNSDTLKKKHYDFLVTFFWLFGILTTLLFLVGSVIIIWEGKESTIVFFFLSSSLFPLGASIGASKQWEMRDIFKT